MRTRATVLALVAIAVSSTGCGDAKDPGTTTAARVPTTTAPAPVTTADYALRAERRCKVIVGVLERNAIAGRRYGQAPSDVTLGAFARAYREFFTVFPTQLERLARLTPPDEYRGFQRGLRRGNRIFSPFARRARRLLAGDPTVADVYRVVRLLQRATRSIPEDEFPAELGRRAPSCGVIAGSSGGGDPRDGLAAA